MHHFFLGIVISMQIVSAFTVRWTGQTRMTNSQAVTHES